jgi:putative toxin-antitoxin system toxin component, PIN family
MIISLEILAELTGVLSSKKFNYPPEIVPNIINEIESVCEIVAPVQRITVSKTDPFDNMILECALEARADYIISGDVHLPELLEHG